MSDATARFAELVARSEDAIPLDEAALLIAAHAHPELDVAELLVRLDELAAPVPPGDADSLARQLFRDLRYRGNTEDYGDPRNSYLDDVIARRLGIPITLSVLMLEVGRRARVALVGVGMPGHFLVSVADQRASDVADAPYFDPFDGGRRLDLEGCGALFAALHGPSERFEARYLEPVGPRAILARMLANLERALAGRDPGSGRWVVRLHLALPGLTASQRRQLAHRLGSFGAFSEAAAALESLASALADDAARTVELEARALRARAN